jgi:hypothetical protein
LLFILVAVAGCGDDSASFDFASPPLDMSALPPATVLASAQTLTNCIAVDTTGVYWTDEGGVVPGPDQGASSRVLKVALAGGMPTVLGEGADAPGCVVVDATNAYYTQGGGTTLMKVPLGGGTAPMALASSQHILTLHTPHLAVAGGFVYWITDVYGDVDAYNGKNALVRVSTSGGSVETVFSDLAGEPGGLFVDATNVYYSDQSGMYVRALAGGAPTAVGQSTLHNNRFAVDSSNLALVEVASIGSGDVALYKLDGSGRVQLLSKLASAVALDASGLYANLDGELVHVSLDGKTTTTLSDQAPRAIALDASNIYFTDGASILKLAK